MATYTVERTYWVPVFQHVTVEAESASEAMAKALAHESWDSAKTDYEASRAEHVTGCWEGREAYPHGDITGLAIPPEFQPSASDRPAIDVETGAMSEPVATLGAESCLHCGEERGIGPETGSLWTCSACNSLNEPEVPRLFRNHYSCDQCGATWQDEWSCACNDKCECGAEIEPSKSEEIGAE